MKKRKTIDILDEEGNIIGEETIADDELDDLDDLDELDDLDDLLEEND